MPKNRTHQERLELTAKIIELKKQFTNAEIAEKLKLRLGYVNGLMWKHNKKMKKENIINIVSDEFERLVVLAPENSENNQEGSEILKIIVYDPDTMQKIEMHVSAGLGHESIKREVLERLEIAIKI